MPNVAKWSQIRYQNGPQTSKMMPKLRQRSAKSTHGIPKASFALILLNFGGFGATPGAQKEPIGVILGGILRPKRPPWPDQVQIRSIFRVILDSKCD